MFTNPNKSYLYLFKKHAWVLALPFIVGLFLISCGDSPIDAQTNFTDSSATNVNNDIVFVPDQFDAVGTIQGTVIDKATGTALNEIAVSLLFKPAEADEPSVLTDSTDSEGTFAFTGVPVNSDAEYSSSNSPYTLKISAEEYDNYRDLYRMNAPLGFSATGGDGAATNLVSDVTIPLSEQAVILKGKAHTSANAILSDVRVELYQDFNPIINGSSETSTRMLIDSAMTGSDGSFSFEGVEEKTDVMLRFIDDSDLSKVINYEYTSIDETPAAQGTTLEMNLGVINVSSSNESGAFYITSVTPAPGSDLSSLDTTFVYEFNRPVAENTWTDASRGFGSGTFKDEIEFIVNGMKKSPGDLEFSVSWSEDRTALTITPQGLMDATEYTLDVEDAIDHDKFVDEYENTLSYGASDFEDGEVETLDFSIGVNNEKPHTPTLTAEANTIIDYNSGTADLTWQVDESTADVKLYEIWVKESDEQYEMAITLDRDNITFNEAEASSSIDYDSPLVLLRGFGNGTPEEAVTHKVKVRAISDNLRHGDFSNEIVIADTTEPDVIAANYNGGTGELTVEFDEPMIKAQVENASNYSFEDSGGSSISANIESVEYTADYGTSTATELYEVVITVEDPTSLSTGAGEVVIIDSGVTDLAGNGMDTDDANNDNDGNENKATY